MKQIIVMSAMIMLGVYLFNLIAGDGDNSVKSELRELWKAEIACRADAY
ncbi:MAG: hypothetical protein FWG42_09885 [Clostridiales bacterium]|nr:hypothetical protein [Clostridiales bacterium]